MQSSNKLPILVGSVALTYAFQRSKNTWIGMLGHAFNNGLPLVILILVALRTRGGA